ncbi:MAG: type II toxin-antitoxin system RelE/ParE family toxin [Rhizobiaceae bacterium]
MRMASPWCSPARATSGIDLFAYVNYSSHTLEVRQTVEFRRWFGDLRDLRAKEHINRRIIWLEAGLFGDAKFFDGIGELRIDHGPGYRLYFARRGNALVLLLCGGDKSSQARDIRRAIQLAQEV